MSVLLENVRKSYRTPEGAVSDVIRLRKFKVDKGAQRVITGRSGSGKTTLLNLIGGIVTPDEGSVSVEGTEISRLSEAARDRFRARTIGTVFQTFNLIQGYTAFENVLLGMLFAGKVEKVRATALLDRVGLKDRMSYLPTEMSVGQQQRVSIARALANNPSLILADEPTGNLDPATGETIISLLKDVCRESGATLLIVTHQPQVMASFADVVDLSTLGAA
jgi:putative ABC transport system ATP-binding protein